MAKYFDDLEIFALLVTAVCHNIDHLGMSQLYADEVSLLCMSTSHTASYRTRLSTGNRQ